MPPSRCAAVALALAACATDPPDSELTITRTIVGDTAVVAIRGPQGLQRSWTSDSIHAVWTPEDFGAVRRFDVGAGVVVASDGGRVIGFRLADGTTFPVGVRGEGPGEYRRVASVTMDSAGQITVVDPGQGRVLRFDATGQALPEQARPLTASPAWNVQFVTPAHAGSTGDLIVWDRGFVSLHDEDTLRVLRLLPDSGTQALFAIPQGMWTRVDGVLAKREAYGPQPLIAVHSRAGAVATTGTDYLIRWWRPGATPEMLRIEREWQREVAGQEREAPEELIAGLGQRAAMLRTVVAGQDRGEFKHAIDKVVLIGPGRLLVKVVD